MKQITAEPAKALLEKHNVNLNILTVTQIWGILAAMEEYRSLPPVDGMRWVKASERLPEAVNGKRYPKFVKVQKKKYGSEETYMENQTAYCFPDRFKSIEFDYWDDYSEEDFPYIEDDKEHGTLWLRAGWYNSIDCEKCDGYWSSPLNVVEWLEEGVPQADLKIENRCCGRCDGVNDICVADTVCEPHKVQGCEQCYGSPPPFPGGRK